jgi:predicted dehydrogenase
MNRPPTSQYGLSDVRSARETLAPALDYLPRLPLDCRQRIGLIGAGGISEYHLRAYRALGLEVVAICDLDRDRAAERGRAFYPDAAIETDYRRVLQRDDIAVVDITTHPLERLRIIPDAIQAGKHILSQKPLVTDLQDGHRLVDLAERRGIKFAVNQNGRWAPHFSYLRQAVAARCLGPLSTIDFCLQWDHTWTVETSFNEIPHLILFDFGIHWFDMATALLADARAERVFASVRRAAYQTAKPPFLAHAVIDYPHAQVRLNFNAHTSLGQEDRTVVVGRDGTLRAWGPGLNDQQVELWTSAGQARPELQGCWFENGFQGTMSELLIAIGENREPENSARENLRGLQLCFAAIASANRGEPVDPATIERLES